MNENAICDINTFDDLWNHINKSWYFYFYEKRDVIYVCYVEIHTLDKKPFIKTKSKSVDRIVVDEVENLLKKCGCTCDIESLSTKCLNKAIRLQTIDEILKDLE